MVFKWVGNEKKCTVRKGIKESTNLNVKLLKIPIPEARQSHRFVLHRAHSPGLQALLEL